MSTHKAEQDRGWSRRGFIAAVGAGALVACQRQSAETASVIDSAASTPPVGSQVTIKVYGAFILVPHHRGADIYMPRTDGGGGRPHRAFLGQYEQYGSGGGAPTITDLAGDITLTGGQDGLMDYGDFPDFKDDILPDGAVMRAYSSQVYVARISLVGGSFSTDRDQTLTFDFTAALRSRRRIQNKQLPYAVTWNAGTDTVRVRSSGTGLPTTLTPGTKPAIVIGHLPTEHPADRIYHSREISVGDEDTDFKWLYRAFHPQDNDSPNPWPEPLPVPKLVRMVEKNTFTILDEKSVGSPTCFGGCFGC